MNISEGQQAYFDEVWNFVRQVPRGKVVTYGQIAQALPKPQEIDFHFNGKTVSIAQLVGNALAICPEDVPWHRVINAQGKVSSRAGASQQLQLLNEEGLNFTQGRIDLNQYQWQGPNGVNHPMQQQLF